MATAHETPAMANQRAKEDESSGGYAEWPKPVFTGSVSIASCAIGYKCASIVVRH